MNATMIAAVCKDREAIVVEEVRVPEPADGQVLVAEVLVVKPEARKRAVAEELGAHHTLDPVSEDLAAAVFGMTDGNGADCVIEAVGIPETVAATVSLIRRGGTIMLIGWTGNQTDSFDLTNVTLNELMVFTALACADG